MRRMLLTTALVVPLSAGYALAQEDQGQAQTEGEVQVIEPEVQESEGGAEQAAEGAAQEAEQAAEQAGEAAESAAEAAGEAAQGAAEETGEAMQGAAEETGEAAQETGQAMQEAGQEAEQAAEGDTEEAQAAEGGAAAGGEALPREQAPNELRVDWITGATVMSPEGESIGNINDLILDSETGQMTAAIVGVGGFLGIGEKQIAMAWDTLQIDYDANEITSDITQDEAEAAPDYVFRDQESAPAAESGPATGAGNTMGSPGTTGGMGSTSGGATAPAGGGQ